jgi:hypothetical protein
VPSWKFLRPDRCLVGLWNLAFNGCIRDERSDASGESSRVGCEVSICEGVIALSYIIIVVDEREGSSKGRRLETAEGCCRFFKEKLVAFLTVLVVKF